MTDATGQGRTFRVVRIYDPAIRWSNGPREGHTDYNAYRDARPSIDPATLEVKTGERPRIYHFRRLRRSEQLDVEALGAAEYRHTRAFIEGVTMIEMEDGRVVRPAQARWSTDELDAMEFLDINDIGSIVFLRSRIPLGLPAIFEVPLSSAAALVASLSPFAAPSQIGAAPGSSKSAGTSEP